MIIASLLSNSAQNRQLTTSKTLNGRFKLIALDYREVTQANAKASRIIEVLREREKLLEVV